MRPRVVRGDAAKSWRTVELADVTGERLDAPANGALNNGGRDGVAVNVVSGTQAEAEAAPEGADVRVLAAEKEAEGHAAGYQRGFEEGKAEGLQRGVAEGRAKAERECSEVVARLRSLAAELVKPVASLEGFVEEALVGLAMELARFVVRGEVAARPGELVQLLRKALAAAPVEIGAVRVRLHPDDLAEVAQRLDGEADVSLAADESVERGGCLVGADLPDAGAQDRQWRVPGRAGLFEADLTLASRWREAMRTLFGEGGDQ